MQDDTEKQEASPEAQALVRRTAGLARLEVDDAQVARLAPQFARLLEAFRTIALLDVSGQTGMARPGGDGPRLRADAEGPSLSVEAALANAPDRREDFYSVPRAIPAPAKDAE